MSDNFVKAKIKWTILYSSTFTNLVEADSNQNIQDTKPLIARIEAKKKASRLETWEIF